MRYYSGIGSRETPPDITRRMTNIAREYALEGLILRSGGAEGADHAFEKGAGNQKEIWLPWRGFNGNESLRTPTAESYKVAERFHPSWPFLRWPVKALMARNCHIILGQDLRTPSEFVVCWTPHGEMKGGTAMGLRVAMAYEIPITNFGKR